MSRYSKLGGYRQTSSFLIASPDYCGSMRFQGHKTGIAIASRHILLLGERHPFLAECTAGPAPVRPDAMRAEDV